MDVETAYYAPNAQELSIRCCAASASGGSMMYETWDDDVLDRTKAAVDAEVDLDEEWNGRPVSIDIAEQYEHARTWFERDRSFDQYNPRRNGEPVVFV